MAEIAVFGGMGEVGSYVVEALRALGYHPAIIGRQPRPEVANYQRADLFDARRVEEICASHDMVINAAGPAAVIRDHVARIALLKGVPYVDVGGEEDVFTSLAERQGQASSPCVLGAGFVPGFSSLLAYLVRKKMQRVDKFELYVGGIEVFTPTSAKDFLASLSQRESYSGCGVVGGRITRIATREGVAPIPGAPVFSALPYLSAEHQRVARSLSFDHYRAYNLIADKHLVLADQGDPSGRLNALVAASEALTSQHGTQQYCVVHARGWLADQPVRFELNCRFDNGYRLTGWVAAVTADQLIRRSRRQRPSLCWLSEAVEIESLLEQLSQANLFRHWEMSLTPDEEVVFEEGVL
ncbi:NAD-dependent epimerase/dehydratase family protein [Vreelandella alkaliphila]|uniref:NAD-dependent epimerase/dehydratase family protein n=1 Tax=Halomonadaceae TaxID=28256 RepID=UPI001868FB49|nr:MULTISPECIES: NAD-dependent epimerase/dehydratase family protein [Halomonas]